LFTGQATVGVLRKTMRSGIATAAVCAAILAVFRPAHSQPPAGLCPQCALGPPTTISTNSITVAASFGPAKPAVSNAAACYLEYRLGSSTLHSVKMSKSATAFTGSIFGLPPAKAVQYRMSCGNSAGAFVVAKTQPTQAKPPKLPAVVSTKWLTAERLEIELQGDPTEPTVSWIEYRVSPPPKEQWELYPDSVDTFVTKKVTVGLAPTAARVGVRNSAGTSYSPVTTPP